MDLFWDRKSGRREPILGAVGKLQFEVVQFRLATEYGVKADLEPLAFESILWVEGSEEDLEEAYFGSGVRQLEDAQGRPVVLTMDARSGEYLAKRHPKLRFSEKRP